ncbi:peptidase inhibitor family I36 protein [Streptomyces sp. NPDC037389]|uniref:peptidase inhibitor family I36 protein n=1 Tax=Streptomyces sp. NPDC037389 TaxID=3155369 RepID=UPI0033E47C3A
MRAVVLGLAAVLALAGAPAAQARAATGTCSAGQLCLWPKPGYRGAVHASELAGIDIESCTALPAGVTGASLANRTGHPVTTYQSATCAETGEFDTYPSGTWTPESPYVVRAYKVWEH